MDFVLYSNGCPNCRALKQMLDNKGVHYTEENSVEKMVSLGLQRVPVLSVDGELLEYRKATEFVHNLEASHEKQ